MPEDTMDGRHLAAIVELIAEVRKDTGRRRAFSSAHEAYGFLAEAANDLLVQESKCRRSEARAAAMRLAIHAVRCVVEVIDNDGCWGRNHDQDSMEARAASV